MMEADAVGHVVGHLDDDANAFGGGRAGVEVEQEVTFTLDRREIVEQMMSEYAAYRFRQSRLHGDKR